MAKKQAVQQVPILAITEELIALLKNTEIVFIRLTQSLCKQNLKEQKQPQLLTIPQHLRYTMRSDVAQNDAFTGIRTTYHCAVLANYDAPGTGKPLADVEAVPLAICASFQVFYTVKGESAQKLSGEFLAAFANQQSFVIWPYWRELVSTETARMGLPALIVPFLKIMQPVESPSPPKRSDQKSKKSKIGRRVKRR